MSQYQQGLLFWALVAGALCGLVPLIVGYHRRQISVGIVGLICCIIAGFILGIILALPVAAVFTIIICSIKSPTLTEQQRKACPHCGESIVVGARKCRFCGERLTSNVKHC